MPRSAPTGAYRELMDLTAADGNPISVSQLERWRRERLLPAPDRVFLGRAGTRTSYPQEVKDLARALARRHRPGRLLDDTVLLAFFCDSAPTPELPLKLALVRTYFPHRERHRDTVARTTDAVPDDPGSERDIYYDWAEAEAVLEVEGGGTAVRQMRANLRRLPDLARAPREEVDSRLVGVLTHLNSPRLPENDLDLMRDLEAAIDLDSEKFSLARLAVWEYVATTHAGQMGRFEETNGQERFDTLCGTPLDELHRLRDEVVAAMQETWRRATGGHRGALALETVSMARGAARMLAEWTTARKAHPEGSSLADVCFTASLLDLARATALAWLLNRADRQRAAMPSVDRAGEGRAAFIARTTGATGRRRRTH
ncbi:hypothetical protein [Kitasatospora purpeofusca]|uniref:hypothetical protein n=1 Tax=Kitasatospora purpeofusca TaxID=67352 RepID=UPI002A5A0238|nr:hypothetical protein [Kitasatospora purpeofusca]MDY0810616.1 hypothetical protein [Kitasatospora purpeofusca]